MKIKLSHAVKFIQGKNTSRSSESNFYDVKAQELDLNYECYNEYIGIAHNEPQVLNVGDIIFNNSTKLASIASIANSGKTISNNFTKFVVDETVLDRYYLLYLLNESTDLSQQLNKSVQASGAISRVRVTELKELTVNVPLLTKQKQLGLLYYQSKKIERFYTLKGKLHAKACKSIINKIIKGGNFNDKM